MDTNKILVLEEQLYNLRTEVGKLTSEAQHWKGEVEKLGVNPNYIVQLEEKAKNFEKRASNAEARLHQKLEELVAISNEAEQMQRLADAFGQDAQLAFFKLKDAWGKKRKVKTVIGSILGFVGGVAASIAAAYLGLVLPGLG